MTLLTITCPGTLGTNTGPVGAVTGDPSGMIGGVLEEQALSMFLLKTQNNPCLCVTKDAGLYVDETTEANEGTADDVEIVGSTIAVGDAIYVGHATVRPDDGAEFEISTQGNYTTTTFDHLWWDGAAWVTHTTIVDGTTAFEAATGRVSITWDDPGTAWKKTLVHGILGYWTKIVCTATAGSTTPCQIEQIWNLMSDANPVWSDDTTDANDAGAADVVLLGPSNTKVGDGVFIGSALKFCQFHGEYSTARTGTATITPQYWNGTALTNIPAPVNDDSVGFSAAAGGHLTQFVPPSDWVANTTLNGPNGVAGFFIFMKVSAHTSVTVVPVASRFVVYPLLSASGRGIRSSLNANISMVDMFARTISAANNDSIFLLVNKSTGDFAAFTWTQILPADQATVDLDYFIGDELVVVQIQEDGTTELADAQFTLRANQAA